ncbi:MAG: alpha-L-fucosidase [Eubacterium sp.]|nr:alpha-L-fucosidase [Eubacterium sp.]
MTIEEQLELIDEIIEKGRYKADWASLCSHKTPEWYHKAKLGIFIHWGIYSVPAYGNEWYSREMYDKTKPAYRHHIKTYGNHRDFGYKDFIPMFKAERFNPSQWAVLFKKSGARYIMPVCEHHDGFAMYNTEFNRWNAVNMGPCRDIIGEIKRACENEGLVFCGSSHRAEHYFFMNMGRTIDSDVQDERYEDFYGPAYYCKELASHIMHITASRSNSIPPSQEFLRDWLARTCELIDKYQPKVLYFDWWIHNDAFKPYLKKLAAYYYNRAEEWGFEVTINYKHNAFLPGAATFDVERGALKNISSVPWQTCTSIAKNSWGYTENNKFKSVRHVVCDLIDIVSKNGMMLLNVGPRADGTITDEETAVLLAMGKWLTVNGEGIYDTVPWKAFGEGRANVKEGFFQDNKEKGYTHKDFRFTYKNGCVYAFWMKPKNMNKVKIKSFKAVSQDVIINRVEMLGSGKALNFVRNKKYMQIELDSVPQGDLPVCFKIELG